MTAAEQLLWPHWPSETTSVSEISSVSELLALETPASAFSKRCLQIRFEDVLMDDWLCKKYLGSKIVTFTCICIYI